LRDDLSSLFSNIIKVQNQKIELLIDFRNNEFELKHLLAGKVEDKIIGIINAGNEIIDKIDLCDYHISGYTDEVKRITGIDPANSPLAESSNRDVKLGEFIKNKNLIDTLFTEINKLKTENLETMKHIADELSQSGDDLDRINKVKNIYSKDLRSSWF